MFRILGGISLPLARRANPDVPDLARLTLSVTLGGQGASRVELRRLFRPEAMSRPRGIPEEPRPGS